MACVRELLLQHLEPDTQGDEDVLEYVIGVMEDDDFEFGDDGEYAFDAVGDMMVSAGYVTDEQAARDLCKALAAKLKVNGVHEAEDTRASTRMLEGGPKALGHEEGPLLFEKQSARHLIQTPFENDKDLSMMTERDRLRLEKRMEKDEKSARAAIAAAQARADSSVVGSRPTIMRNTMGVYGDGGGDGGGSSGGGGARDIHLEDVTVSNGGQELITDTSATFAFGRRYGLVGRNGSGKSTLLRHMSAYELKGMPSNCQVLHVEQEVAGNDTSVLQAVLECDQDREQLLVCERLLLARIAAADAEPSSQTDEEASSQLAEVYRKMEEIDAYGAEARAASILAGLSFSREMQQRPTRTFSGGWRMRVALARALFVAPDLLLLDEPTNHLDLHAVLWLEDYLLQWPKTVIIVSHAREFLNATCTDIIHLHSRKLTFYRGNYDNFQKTMQERMRNQLKAAEGVERERKHMQSFIDKFRFNAKRAALVQSRIKALSRLADVQVMERDPEYLFSFPDPGDTPNTPILGFTDVSFNYPGGPTLFKNLNFGIDLESRLAIVGPNGVGKSTLLKLISGDLAPVTGTVSRNPRVRIATFSQHHVDGLDLALTPLLYMMKCYPSQKEHEHRAHLGKFGIDAELAGQAMHTLSGGQKSRVALSRVTWTKPHILLLDEPSNHLDMDAVDALIEGLTLFKGGVLMVSHDQFLIETTVDELWMCESGEITAFHGSFSDYKKRLRSLR